MRDYALIKQSPGFRDMFAFPFLNNISFDQIDTINEIYPEWTMGKFYASQVESSINTPASYANMKAGIYHNTEYDILLVGMSRGNIVGNVFSGIRAASDSGNLTTYRNSSVNPANTHEFAEFFVIDNAVDKYLYVSQHIDNPVPIFGIKLKPGITPLINPMPSPNDDRSAEPEPDEPKTEPEPETKSTRKK